MAVVSRKEYIGVSRDALENYKGKQLLFISWDHHLLICAPIMFRADPQTTLGELIDQQLQPLLQADPDAAAIDWNTVQWLKGNQPWVPDYAASLEANGIGHKEQLRMRTPGLNSLVPVN
ncbi:hypothetical protein D3C81_1250700 [compost metagenome]